MRTSAIHTLRHMTGVMRGISATVLVTFTMLILMPTVQAAQQPPAKPAQAPAPAPRPDTDEDRLSRALQDVEETLARLEDQVRHGRKHVEEDQRLAALEADIRRLDQNVQQNFTAVEKHIRDHHLPAAILERHQAMVAAYKRGLAEFLTDLQQAAQAPAGKTLAQVQKARKYLADHPVRRRHHFDDPHDLPNRGLQPDPGRKPRETEQAFRQAGLHSHPHVRLAALGDFTFDRLPGAGDPAYLAETPEIRLTQALRDQAAALGHDPVKIYHWVRNHVQWQPTWGAAQDADLTLSARRGNALDIAGLLIALLRASGIPARYVHGTIEVPADPFRNWAGGFQSVEGAVSFASAGGIPITSLLSGGQIANVRLEHVWVEAAIDYEPSRGAKNRDADTWVPMDPSYKQYQVLPGLDAAAIAGIDLNAVAQTTLNSATVNSAEGWLSGLDPTALQAAQTQMQTALKDYIAQHYPHPTVGDILGGYQTIVQEFPVLPGSLPHRTVAVGARYGQLPAALQNTLTYAFGRDLLGDLIDPVTLPLAKLNNQRLTLSFQPATAADEEALRSLLPEGEITDLSQLPSSIPAYLIQVVPELKLNGEVLKTGAPMRLGYELSFLTQVRHAGRTLPARNYDVIAGSYLAVAADSGNLSPARLQAVRDRLAHTKTTLESADTALIGSLTREDLLGDLFQAGLLGYYAQFIGLAHVLGLQQHGHYHLAAGTGTYGYEPDVSYLFGIPRAIKPGGAAMNIPIFHITGQDANDAAKKRDYLFQVGLLSSALEHAVPEQMFVNDQNPGEGISAVKALQKANALGQRIYHITPANQASTLPNIHHNSLVMEEIRNALNAGREVLTHTDAVSVPGWTGAGYILFDPKTGDGAFKIGGGQNGGAYKLGVAIGISFGVLAAGLLWSLAYPPLASIFAALLVVLVSQLIAAFIAVDLVLGYKGDWCLGAGLITGLEIGLAIFGVSAGTYVEAVIMEALLFVIDKHIDFPTAPQCDVYK
jgi:transglutaminase-like putative cysteine protease